MTGFGRLEPFIYRLRLLLVHFLVHSKTPKPEILMHILEWVGIEEFARGTEMK
jgi:hypothetical protein